MKTSDLIGPTLDWAVAFIEGGCKAEPRANYWLEKWLDPERRYLCESASTDWSHGGPIIERESLSIAAPNPIDPTWCAMTNMYPVGGHKAYGPTPLIVAMRCFVASQLGDEVEIPGELL